MPLRKLFLCHYSGDAAEVSELATELRLRGIPPWVDKEGGFAVADESAQEARRAIREDCFGLLLYATRNVFGRPFIRDVEMHEARFVHKGNPDFLLFAVPRRISFGELAKQSENAFKIDLSAFHTARIPRGPVHLGVFGKIAGQVLSKVLRRTHKLGDSLVSLQFSTRETFPDEPADVLCVDATRLFSGGDPAAWERVLAGLRDVKSQVTAVYGRPRVNVHGSKHLTAAFMFGRVFERFELEIRQTPDEVWRTDAPDAGGDPFHTTVQQGLVDTCRLFVEIASGSKNVAGSVDEFIARSGLAPAVRLQLRPLRHPLVVDNAMCRAMARQTYREIESVMRDRRVEEVHLFVAAHQAFVMMLARQFKGMPPVQFYEWSGVHYIPSYCIPGGPL